MQKGTSDLRSDEGVLGRWEDITERTAEAKTLGQEAHGKAKEENEGCRLDQRARGFEMRLNPKGGLQCPVTGL